MIRRIFALVWGLCLLGSLAACADRETEPTQEGYGPAQVQEDASLIDLRHTITRSEKTCAILYLGYYEGTDEESFQDFLADSGCVETYPFLTEIPRERRIEAEGCDVYCIIPCDAAASVTVSEWLIGEDGDSYTEGPGDVLYHSDVGDPVLLRCNVSDIMPNLHVEVTCGDAKASFEPMLSLRDGSVIAEGTLDLTEYENCEEE